MAVLHRSELESSPLADLHAIASELGLEGFRAKRKDDLIGAILAAQGGERSEASLEDDREPDEVPSDETFDGAPGVALEEPPVEEEEPPVEEEPEVVEDEVSDEEIATGTLDVLTNGSGFLRLDPHGQSRDDVYVSPAQIRRCELRGGDEVSGPGRPPRRNERHPSLIRVETVNGAPAEPPEERPWFGDLTPVFPRERLDSPPALDAVPYGKGSRVAIYGPPGGGATRVLRELAATLSERYPDLALQVVLAGVRPEEVAEWAATGVEVSGGSFDLSPDAQAQAAELAVERAKRQVERGRDAAVVIDSLGALPASARRRVFGAGRATEEGGSLTVIAATGDALEVLRWATTRIALEPGGEPVGETLHADRL
ncbi:MAG: Rho termination factor N-terminal domain-containing protein [Thermoleophilaceae bacterium]